MARNKISTSISNSYIHQIKPDLERLGLYDYEGARTKVDKGICSLPALIVSCSHIASAVEA
jgi:hypothetical protein